MNMGNHAAGKAMGIAADAVLKSHYPRNFFDAGFALSILDDICEPWRGCDAEFEAEDPKRPGHINPEYTFHDDFNAPLGKLIAAAFAPDKRWESRKPNGNDRDEDPVWQEWYESDTSSVSRCQKRRRMASHWNRRTTWQRKSGSRSGFGGANWANT